MESRIFGADEQSRQRTKQTARGRRQGRWTARQGRVEERRERAALRLCPAELDLVGLWSGEKHGMARGKP